MIMLMILGSITIALVTMSVSEPRITANLQQGAEALALAEAGVERVIWALSFGGLTMPASPPYDGTGPNPTLGPGEYRMIVTAGAGMDRNVTAEGYVPSQANARAVRRVMVTVTALRNLDPPCALCVRGTLTVTGNARVDARSSTCGSKRGVSISATSLTGQANTLSIGGAARIYAGDGNDAYNQETDYQTDLTHAQFDGFTFAEDELNVLREVAKARGAYIRPTSSDQIVWSASDWNPSPSDPDYATKPKDGLVFVDTVNGQPLGPPGDPGNPAKLANVKITGANNSGWLVVMGGLTIDGNVGYRGLLYAVNDIVYRGTGTGALEGAMVSQNIVDAVETVVDSSASGNANIYYNCDHVRNGNSFVPTAYLVKPGTWREAPG
jgi:hypothetical protein